MSKLTSRLLAILIVLMLLLAPTGCGGGEVAEENGDTNGDQEETMLLKMGTGLPGGLWYPAAAKLVEAIEKELPYVRASVSPTPGEFNLLTINEGKEMQMAQTTTMMQHAAWNGLPPNFDEPLENLRLIGTQEVMLWQVAVPAKSDIYTLKDLHNKRINAGEVGDSDRTVIEGLLGALDITFDSIKADGGEVHALGLEDAADMMQDGHLDCLQTYGAIMPSLINLATQPGIRFIPVEGPEIDALLEQEGWKGVWGKFTLKAGTYEGQDEDVPTIGLLTTIICNADLSDDFVYEVTKIIYESGYQKDTYASSEAAGWPKVCNIEEIVDATSIPLHPGAQKYFEEKGITF